MHLTTNVIMMFILSAFITVKVGAQVKQDEKRRTGLTPFSYIGKNIAESYTGWNSLFHIGAAGLTYFIVTSNLDASVLEATSKMDYNTSQIIGMPGIITGYLAPVLVPVGMYLFSGKDSDTRNASFAAIQAVGIAAAANAILKSITGRSAPNPDAADKIALSKDFNFSFFGGGAHYGWPSGHIMTNMAMASAIAAYYNDKPWVKYVCYGYVSVLAVAVLIDERGSAHWLSEIVAGGLMGYAIGSTTGRNFREASTVPPSTDKNSVQITPSVGNNYYGILLGISF